MRKNPTKFRERFQRWKEGKLVYENGRPLYVEEDDNSDEVVYKEIMKDVARKNYKTWGYSSPNDAWLDQINNPTYDYRKFYTDPKFYDVSANAELHWPDAYKTPLHESFSNESFYHGKKSNKNPYGLRGGLWVGDKFIPAAWQNPIRIPKYEDGLTPIKKSTVNTNEASYDPNQDLYTARYSLPEVKVQGTYTPKKKPYWISPKNPRMAQLTADEAIKGIHAAVNPLLAWTSPSLYVGAIRESDNVGQFVGSMLRGNSGLFTEEYSLEHPIISSVANTALDGFGTNKFLKGYANAKRIINNIKNRNLFAYAYLPPFGYNKPIEKFEAFAGHILRDYEVPNPKYGPFYDEHLIPDAAKSDPTFLGFRDEAWRKYLGIEENTPLYIDNGDGTFSYNLGYVKKNTLDYDDYLLPYDKRMFDKDVINDYVTQNGGNVASLIIYKPEGTYNRITDVWDLQPFLGNEYINNPLTDNVYRRLINIADDFYQKNFYKGLNYRNKFSYNYLGGKFLNRFRWSSPPKILYKIGDKFSGMEMGPILGGKPFTMRTDVPLFSPLRKPTLYKDGKMPKFEDGEELQIDLSDVQRRAALRLQYDPVSRDLSKPMSPVDPVGEAAVEYAALGPLFKGAYNTVKAIKPIMEGRKAAIDFLASNAYRSKYTAKYPQDLAEIAAKQIGAIKNSKFIPFPIPFLRKTVGLNFKLPSGNSVQWYNTLSDNLPFLKEAATHESFHAGSKGLWNTGIREHVHFSDASKALDLTDRAVLNVANMAKKSLKNRLFPKSADKRIALRVEDARNYYRNPDELRSHALTAEIYGPGSLNYKSLKDAFGEDAIRKLQNFYYEWALPKLGLTIE